MNMLRRSIIGTIAIVVALTTSAAAEGLPDILGVQPGMPARDAHAKLQAALPKNKIQVMSDTLPTIDKPVIKAFSSAPPGQIMMGMEGDQVEVDVTLPPNKQTVWRVVRQHWFGQQGHPEDHPPGLVAREVWKRNADELQRKTAGHGRQSNPPPLMALR
jgi:hypothetical protein